MNNNRERRFTVTIKFVAQANMHQFHELLSAKRVNTNSQALKILDLVLRELAEQRFTFVNSLFF